jgi:SAM-dependent methyltransferase
MSQYFDPRLTAVYDALNPPGRDTAYHLALAGEAPRRILDIGCGTGALACELAARGHSVTGADPAPAMLAVAQNRPGFEAVTWIEAGAADLAVETRFDLIIMTGHAFQVLLTDEAIRAALANLRQQLAPGGILAFETRNPLVREWETWTPDETRERVEVPGLGIVEVHNDIRAVDGSLVTYETHFRFGPDDTVVTADTLRFVGQTELAGFLAGAGFGSVTWFGDWDRLPFGPGSSEIIVEAG